MDHGPALGYYLEPEKSVLICSPGMKEADLAPLAGFHFHHETGERYLGRYLGEEAKRRMLIGEKLE